ncbi:MAG: hypothetical protein J5825_09415 [Lachnospiraceae bacterium]|nr:hypothetical protein [Lachnospiraceae bacterium]
MDFNFNWEYVYAGAPYITISETGLAVNSPACAMIDNPERVLVGFDEEKMAIGIKDVGDMENAKSYVFFSRMNNGWVRIGCKDFVKYLSEISGISFSPAKRFIAKLNQKEKILYITIKCEEGESDNKTE